METTSCTQTDRYYTASQTTTTKEEDNDMTWNMEYASFAQRTKQKKADPG